MIQWEFRFGSNQTHNKKAHIHSFQWRSKIVYKEEKDKKKCIKPTSIFLKIVYNLKN